MSTPNRTEINRANAQFSTGPKTPEGKQKSSLNALRHGLTGQIVVMPTEDLAAYQQLLKSLADDLAPKGAIEEILVQTLADTTWRMNRVSALETNLLTLGIVNSRSPITDAPDQVQDAFAIASALESQSKALSNLSLHSQRLTRQFEKVVNQLQALQEARRAKEETHLDNFLDIKEMFEDKGETYDGTEDGFVFSKDQIHDAIRRRNREHLLVEAYHYEAAA
jgi:hypothetical protein